MLDRSRYYAIVYGDPVKKALQDGIFYKGNGEPVNSKKVGSPKKDKPKAVVVEQTAPDPRLDKLKGMHISKLKKLAVAVSKATDTEHPELKGRGLKANLIAYIAKNTD